MLVAILQLDSVAYVVCDVQKADLRRLLQVFILDKLLHHGSLVCGMYPTQLTVLNFSRDHIGRHQCPT